MKTTAFPMLALACALQSVQGADISGTAETGFLAVLGHRIQLSKDGTYFDYRREGGQDVLFAVTRFALDWRVSPKH